MRPADVLGCNTAGRTAATCLHGRALSRRGEWIVLSGPHDRVHVGALVCGILLTIVSRQRDWWSLYELPEMCSVPCALQCLILSERLQHIGKVFDQCRAVRYQQLMQQRNKRAASQVRSANFKFGGLMLLEKT